MEVFAHRGASARATENTLAAFDLALELGADGLEVDLRATADGRLVALHDATLKRTTGDRRAIAEVTVADLDALPETVRPARLGDILERYGDRTRLLLELKDPTRAVARRVAAAVARVGARASVEVQCVEARGVRYVRAADAGMPVAALCFRLPRRRLKWLDAAVAVGAGSVTVPYRQVDAALVAAAHERSLSVRAWTVNDAAEAARLASIGTDAIITDTLFG